MSTSWHYDLLLPDAAIEGMQATVKRLDDFNTTPEKHNFSAGKPPPTTIFGLWYEEQV